MVNIILLTTTGNSHVVIPKENVTQSSFQEESKAWILINSQSSSSDLGSIMLLGISNMNSCQHFKISVTTTFGQGGILLRIFFFFSFIISLWYKPEHFMKKRPNVRQISES